MSVSQDGTQGSKVRMRTYFIMACVLLFIMALLSSLGKSFVLIFGGLSFFFFFLAWQNRVRDDQSFTGYRRSESRSAGPSFSEKFRAAFRQHAQTETVSPVSDQRKRVIIMASTLVGSVFVIIVAIVIFSSGDEEVDDLYFYKQEGDNYYNAQNFDAAYVSYRRAIAADEKFADGYYGIGNIKSQANEYDSALYYYDRALAIDADNLDAFYGKALVYYSKEDYPRSLQELKYIFDRSDQYVSAYLLAGDNHYVSNQYEPAIGYYETAYELGARSKELLNIMAYIYDQRGDQAKAISFYKETLAYDSTMQDIYKRLGELIPGDEGNYYRAKAAGQQW
jgi:tetratricopeptide (TPR) repeat protein